MTQNSSTAEKAREQVRAASEIEPKPFEAMMFEHLAKYATDSAILAALTASPAQGEWIEREAAAKVAEDHAAMAMDYLNAKHRASHYGGYRVASQDIAAAIRALELPSTPKPQELAGER